MPADLQLTVDNGLMALQAAVSHGGATQLNVDLFTSEWGRFRAGVDENGWHGGKNSAGSVHDFAGNLDKTQKEATEVAARNAVAAAAKEHATKLKAIKERGELEEAEANLNSFRLKRKREDVEAEANLNSFRLKRTREDEEAEANLGVVRLKRQHCEFVQKTQHEEWKFEIEEKRLRQVGIQNRHDDDKQQSVNVGIMLRILETNANRPPSPHVSYSHATASRVPKSLALSYSVAASPAEQSGMHVDTENQLMGGCTPDQQRMGGSSPEQQRMGGCSPDQLLVGTGCSKKDVAVVQHLSSFKDRLEKGVMTMGDFKKVCEMVGGDLQAWQQKEASSNVEIQNIPKSPEALARVLEFVTAATANPACCQVCSLD